MLDIEIVEPALPPPPEIQYQPSLGCKHFPLWCRYDCSQQVLVTPQSGREGAVTLLRMGIPAHIAAQSR